MIFALREGEHVVKKSRITEEQIAFALKQAELADLNAGHFGLEDRSDVGVD